MAFYEENPCDIAKADVVVAIPSFNEADTIGYVAEQVSKGLVDFFGNQQCVLVNCDNHSTDGTKQAFFDAPGEVPKIYLSTPPDQRGKGNNLRNLFARIRDLQAQVGIVVEADVRNLAPQCIRNLGEPVLRGAGYVCPLYVRHKYEATLTSSIVYPLTRCLYGRRVRQPTSGDFGFKAQLVDSFLDSPVWTEAVAHSGVDIWMTTTALNARMPICQSFMGSPKLHRTKDPSAQLNGSFHQVVGTVFDLMAAYPDFWCQVKWSKPTALFGMDTQEVETPVPVEVDMAMLYERFLQGFDKYNEVWQRCFDQTLFHKLLEVRSLGAQHFSFPGQTWARVLFDAAAAYRRLQEGAERTALLDSLQPLYWGKVLSFAKKTERISLQQAEEYIENECMVFEENKPYLIKIWE